MPLADTQAIAVLTRRPPATIRSWAHRGWLPRGGTGPRGRALYATEDAEALAMRLMFDNAPDLRQHLECSGRAMSGLSPLSHAGGQP